MSKLFIVGAVIYLVAKKLDVFVYKGKNGNPNKVVDEYIRDDTEQDVQLFPPDHHVTDALLPAKTGPQNWMAGPQDIEQHIEFNMYGPNGEGPWSNNKKVPLDLTTFSHKDENNLLSRGVSKYRLL